MNEWKLIEGQLIYPFSDRLPEYKSARQFRCIYIYIIYRTWLSTAGHTASLLGWMLTSLLGSGRRLEILQAGVTTSLKLEIGWRTHQCWTWWWCRTGFVVMISTWSLLLRSTAMVAQHYMVRVRPWMPVASLNQNDQPEAWVLQARFSIWVSMVLQPGSITVAPPESF